MFIAILWAPWSPFKIHYEIKLKANASDEPSQVLTSKHLRNPPSSKYTEATTRWTSPPFLDCASHSLYKEWRAYISDRSKQPTKRHTKLFLTCIKRNVLWTCLISRELLLNWDKLRTAFVDCRVLLRCLADDGRNPMRLWIFPSPCELQVRGLVKRNSAWNAL